MDQLTLRVLRQQRGLPQFVAAKQAALSPAHLSLIESGNRNVTPEVAKKLGPVYKQQPAVIQRRARLERAMKELTREGMDPEATVDAMTLLEAEISESRTTGEDVSQLTPIVAGLKQRAAAAVGAFGITPAESPVTAIKRDGFGRRVTEPATTTRDGYGRAIKKPATTGRDAFGWRIEEG